MRPLTLLLLAACTPLPGELDVYQITSEFNDQTYEVQVYDEHPADDYPQHLLVVLDGDQWMDRASRAVHRAMANGDIGDTLVVSVGYGEGANQRHIDYLPSSPHETIGGGVDEFYAFLDEELLSFVNQGNSLPARRNRAIIGHSFGGAAVTWGLFNDGPFGGVIALSPSLYFGHGQLFDEAAAHIANQTSLDAHIYLAAGGLENYGMAALTDEMGAVLRRDADVLNVQINQEILPGREHPDTYPEGLDRGLLELWGTP